MHRNDSIAARLVACAGAALRVYAGASLRACAGACFVASAAAAHSSAAGSADAASQSAQPAAAACPDALPAATRCYRGADGWGAYYWIAIPETWNGALVVHSHGGPTMKAPAADDPVADLKRFAVMVREGYAWAGTTYRQAGFGVADAAEDTDRLRAVFWQRFGRPRWTLLHGQSWGGNVALRVAETLARDADGRLRYDGLLLTSGVVSGGDLAYDFRADLRAVYQYYCANLPLPTEPAYPLWQGLPATAPPDADTVRARVRDCLGEEGARTPRQAAALHNIARVIRIDEDQVEHHMQWATVTFRDLTLRRLGGHNPFGNLGVRYAGSDDDDALNRGVARFDATAEGRRLLRADSAVAGALPVPTISLHAIHDPTVFVESEDVLRRKVDDAGRAGLLLQMFSDEAAHSRLAAPQYAALLRGLMDWVRTGSRPAPSALAGWCAEAAPRYGEACRFDLGYRPPPLESRVYPRAWPAG